jgi:hypothetical protein
MKMTLKYRKAYIRARKKSILKCATKYQQVISDARSLIPEK